jgi:hypothetical protein
MATISDIVTKIKDEFLNRGDITAALTNRCAEAYLTLCSKVPFEDLQVGPESLNCTIGNKTVDLTTLSAPLAGICSIKIIYSTTTGMRLKRNHTRNYDAMIDPANSKPVQYARWGKKIEVWPPPDGAYELQVRYWKQGVLSGTVANTTLVIPAPWEELLMYETLYRAYYMLRMQNDAQALIIGAMQPRMPTTKRVVSQDMGVIPRLWNELLTTISQRENIDEDFSINPLRR